MTDRRNTEITYDWVQYLNDVDADLWTVRKMLKRDYAKFHSKAEAMAFINSRAKSVES